MSFNYYSKQELDKKEENENAEDLNFIDQMELLSLNKEFLSHSEKSKASAKTLNLTPDKKDK